MKKRLIISELTRMAPPRVCIAGWATDTWECIRPVLPPPGIDEGFLFQEGKLVIKPFAEVEFDFKGKKPPRPPHTEDWNLGRRYKPKLIRVLTMLEKRRLLQNLLDENVGSIFGAKIHEGRYVKVGEGSRSLGTIVPKQVLRVRYEQSQYEQDKWRYHIEFLDQRSEHFDLPVTDLAFRAFCDTRRTRHGHSRNRISSWLIRYLRENETFFRIGLAREWEEKRPGCCYLQITGVYTFPDYLEGKTCLEIGL